MRKWIFAIVLLCCLPLTGRAQSLDEVIRLAQDSTIMAFQSRYQFEYNSLRYARFEALRKPQLEFRFSPAYQRIIADPDRPYVYLRNFDRFSSSAKLRLSQKLLGLGGDAFVESQALWSEYFGRDVNNRPRSPLSATIPIGGRKLWRASGWRRPGKN